MSQKFYIIKRNDTDAGLLSYYFTSLVHIIHATESGWIPIIDLKTNYYWLLHSSEEIDQQSNAWDKYFCQPTSYNLENINTVDIKDSQIIFENYTGWGRVGAINFSDLNQGTPLFEYLKKNIESITLNTNLQNHCIEKSNEFLINYEECLGVSFRLTYDQTHPSGHYLQPPITTIMEIVHEKMKLHEFKYLFIASEDMTVIEAFREIWGDKVLAMSRPRVGTEGALSNISETRSHQHFLKFGDVKPEKLIEGVSFNRPNDRFLINCDYLAEMEILSKCGGLIGGRTNGVMYALIRNNGKYKYVYLPTDTYP